MTFEAYAPGEGSELVCFEAYLQLGRAPKHRILHFGMERPMDDDDVDFVFSRLEEVLRGLTMHEFGTQQRLLS